MEKLIIAILIIGLMAFGIYYFKTPRIGGNYYGFELSNKYEIELNGKKSEIFEFKHIKTNARVVYVKNKDEHRFFSISFSTPTKDKTGVAHIIEHSVLSSSSKYKDYDLFFNLNKKTPATFLNAMTADGQIFYLFQSINNKDFQNLMDIYLNVAFEPELQQSTFDKEAWSLNIDKDGKLYYNGVVYNEMKQAYSGVGYGLYMETLKALAPNYEFESGGNPVYITDLTYDGFVNFYKGTHNPSNSFSFIYGNGDMKTELKLLNEEFSKFEKNEPIKLDYKNLTISKPITKTISYPAGKGEDKSYLIYSYVAGNISDIMVRKDLNILDFLLTEYEDAILKKKVLDSGLATDVQFETIELKDKFAIMILFSGIAKENEEKLSKLIDDTFKEISSKGFNNLAEEAIKSAQKYGIKKENRNEFQDSIYYIYLTDLFGGDYKLYLDKERVLSDFGARASEKDYMKNIFNKYIFNNKQFAKLIARPDENMFEKQEQEINTRLSKLKQSMTDKELKELREKTLEREKSESNSEAEFPVLKMSDWLNNPERIQTNELDINGIKILKHNLKTNGLTQIIFSFDISKLSKQDMNLLGLYDLLNDKLDTENYNAGDFILTQIKEMGTNIISDATFSMKKDNTLNARFFYVINTINPNLENALNLLSEDMFKINYSDSKKIKEIINREIEKFEMQYRQEGAPIFTDINNASIAQNRFEKYDFYQYLKQISSNYKKEYPNLIKDIKELEQKVFNQNNLVIDIVTDENNEIKLDEIANFTKTLSDSVYNNKAEYTLDMKNQARIIPARNYKNYLVCDIKNNESWKILFYKSFIRDNYLFPEVRIKGGAYGSAFALSQNGQMIFNSYADPNIVKTFTAYKNTGDFFKNYKAKDRDFDAIKIKVLSKYSSPKTAFEYGFQELSNYLNGIKFEDIEFDFNKIKNLTLEDVHNLSNDFDNCKTNYAIGTIGGKSGIEENKSLYNDIK